MSASVMNFRVDFHRTVISEPANTLATIHCLDVPCPHSVLDYLILDIDTWGDIHLPFEAVLNTEPQLLHNTLSYISRQIAPTVKAVFAIIIGATTWTHEETLISGNDRIRSMSDTAIKALSQKYVELTPKEKAICQLIIHEARKRQDKPGYVYLIKSASGYYKIGRTKNPDDRIKTFSVKLPFEVEYDCLIKTDDMYTLEANLHDHFARQRVNGEWFNLDSDHVDFIKLLWSE